MNLTSVDEDFLITCAKGFKLCFTCQVENVVYDDPMGTWSWWPRMAAGCVIHSAEMPLGQSEEKVGRAPFSKNKAKSGLRPTLCKDGVTIPRSKVQSLHLAFYVNFRLELEAKHCQLIPKGGQALYRPFLATGPSDEQQKCCSSHRLDRHESWDKALCRHWSQGNWVGQLVSWLIPAIMAQWFLGSILSSEIIKTNGSRRVRIW